MQQGLLGGLYVSHVALQQGLVDLHSKVSLIDGQLGQVPFVLRQRVLVLHVQFVAQFAIFQRVVAKDLPTLCWQGIKLFTTHLSANSFVHLFTQQHFGCVGQIPFDLQIRWYRSCVYPLGWVHIVGDNPLVPQSVQYPAVELGIVCNPH